MAVEMIYTQDHLRTHLEVHSQTIPPYQGNQNQVLVTLKTAGQTTHSLAYRHAGGQRVTLPSDLQDLLIQSLLKGDPVTLELPGYSTTLSPKQFASSYQKLQKEPFNNPLQLPFKL